MNSIVAFTDFANPPYVIPNTEEIADSFASFALSYEQALLKRILGRPLYNSFDSGVTWRVWTGAITFGDGDLATDGTNLWESLQAANTNKPLAEGVWWTAAPANRWFDLFYGADYTGDNSRVYHWDGMHAMLKPYIYSAWLSATFDNHSGDGVVVADNENAMNVNPMNRIVASWNEFVKLVGSCHSVIDTLFGFLYYSGDSYDADVTGYDTMREYLAERFVNPGRKNFLGL